MGAQVRPRFEYDDRDFNSDTDPDDFTSLRTRVHFNFSFAEGIQAFIQVQDVRFFGEEASPLGDFDADGFDLHQGYLDLENLFKKSLSIRLGRQEVSFDEERLIGNVDFVPQGQAFDGLRILYERPLNEWDLFALRINDGVARGTASLGDSNGDDVNFYGIYANVKPVGNHLISGYFLWLENEPGDVDRFTTGARLAGSSGPFSYRGEAYYQFGEAGIQDIRAFLIGLRGTYAFGSSFNPSLTFWYDFLSGDEDPEDNDIEVFDTLFATNHRFYGFMDIFLNIPRDTSNRGLQDLALKFSLVPHETTRFLVDFHQFFLATEDDGGQDNLGQEIDVTLSYLFRKRVEITFGYSHFFIEEALENLKNQSDDANWAYIMVDARF
ncbi:MAG: alginate export family protein [Nitrospira sp.]|nr:alginate export family protein [Nitrospira sp.]